MVEVFKTDISTANDAGKLQNKIMEIYPDYRINFDLDDCDKILRIETNDRIMESEIKQLGQLFGHTIEVLE